MDEPDIEKIETEIETAIGELYRGFYRLRKAEAYQVEYDNMGGLLNMLMQDRLHLLKTYKVDP
jgi:hypothetical protein